MNISFEMKAHELFLKHLGECRKYGTSVNYTWAPSTPAWEAMMTKADELCWPLRYHEDLVLVDRQTMHEDPRPCLWGIREGGTHIVHEPQHLRAVKGSFGEVLWHFWDGYTLAEATFEEAMAIADSWVE